MQQITIIQYGAGNLFSVANLIRRLGYTVTCTDNPDILRQADKVIFPGVGQAASAMQRLQANGLDTLIPRLEIPVLGICLGMQLLCNRSEEGNVKGLGIFPADVVKFPATGKIPHMGWNQVSFQDSLLSRGIGEQEWMYFAHSYYLPPNDYTTATCTCNQIPFSAVIHKDNFWGCQFHPEKSAEAGQQLIQNFLNL